MRHVAVTHRHFRKIPLFHDVGPVPDLDSNSERHGVCVCQPDESRNRSVLPVSVATFVKVVTGAATGGPGASSSSSATGFQPDRRVDDSNTTIRVTNVSGNTTEADSQELFQKYGRISRVYLAKNEETLQSRGFAFVSFVE